MGLTNLAGLLDSTSRVASWLMYGFLTLSAAYFAWRGVWRGMVDSGDLAVGFSAGRAWVAGLNPYDVSVLKDQMFLADGAEWASSGLLDQLQNVYFPATLPVFATLAWAPWPLAKVLFVIANVVGSAFIALGLQRFTGWPASRRRALVLAGFILALAPIHTTIASGQTAIMAVAGLLGAMLLWRAGRPALAAVMYGLATVIKVQIGLPFIAYLIWRRRWATAAVAGTVVLASTLLAGLRMEAAGLPWFDAWLANLTALSGPGGINDPGQLNPERYSLINLQFLLFSLSPSGEWIDAITLALVAVAGLALLRFVEWNDPGELLPISVVAVLTLLVAYHRYYDAVLLAFPVAWGIGTLGGRGWRLGVIVLLLALDFVLPFQTALHDLQQSNRIPAWLVDGPLWSSVLLTQHVWALVLMTGVLLVAAARNRADARRGERSKQGRDRFRSDRRVRSGPVSPAGGIPHP